MKNTSTLLVATVAAGIMIGAAGITFAGQEQKKQEQKKQEQPAKQASPPTASPLPGAKYQGFTKSVTTDPEAPAIRERAQAASLLVRQALNRVQELRRSGNLAGAESAAQEAMALAARLSPLDQEEGRRLIGRIRMEQGQYAEALQWLGADWKAGKDVGLDLDVALCYSRMGNTDMAKRYYSDQILLRNISAEARDEWQSYMPGGTSPSDLEANILFVRGQESGMGLDQRDALVDYQAAGRLAPTNAWIAYCTAEALCALHRTAEAEPYYRTAAQYGHGAIAKKARWQLTCYPRRDPPAP